MNTPLANPSTAVRVLLRSTSGAMLLAAMAGGGGLASLTARTTEAGVPPPTVAIQATATPPLISSTTTAPAAADPAGPVPRTEPRSTSPVPETSPEPQPPSNPPVPHPPRKPGVPVSAMAFNICGAMCRHGEVRRTAAYTVDRALANRVAVVFLSEVCHSQFQRMKVLVTKKGYTALFAANASSGRCDDHDARHGQSFGLAMLVRGRATGRVNVRLPVRAGFERRSMLGATATVGGRKTFVAAVHTSPSERAGRAGQFAAIAAYLDRRRAMPTIVGGDFNAMPDNPGLARFYSAAAGGKGRFIEADELRHGAPERSGLPTFRTVPRKIDYVFFSRVHFGHPQAASSLTSMSDHHIYLGDARVRKN